MAGVSSSHPSFSLADRLEVAAGDVVHRARVLVREGVLALPPELVGAVEALAAAVELRAAGFEPEGAQRLIEAQGRRIRELEGRLNESCRRVAGLSDERDERERLAPSSTHNQDAVCVRCRRRGHEHGEQGQCPRRAT